MGNDKDISDATGIPANAMSVYGAGDAMEDFPVLKAFQQYIESEQNRARKRIAGLCVFFGLIVAGLIAVFVTLILAVENRNQTLNDRILELAMRGDKGAGPVVVQPQQDASALVQLTTRLEAMQKQLADQHAESLRQQAQSAKEEAESARRLAAAQLKQQPGAKTAAEERERKFDADVAKLRRAHEILAEEKAKLAAERERLRLEEVERQRRRLYPEYYARRDGLEIRRETPSERGSASRKTPADVEDDDDLTTAVSYFDDEPETISVKSDGKTSSWQIPRD